MRYVPRALLAGGLGLAAAFLAACGAGSGLLSASQASALNSQLDAAAADLSNNNCLGANRAIESVQTQVAGLPGSIDPTLVSDLGNGANAVRTLARRDCGVTVAPKPDTTSTPMPTTKSTKSTTTPTVTHTTSTSTSTTSTSTVTTPTATTPTAPTTPSTPATTTPGPGTTSTGANGGAGLPPAAGSPGGGGPGDGAGNGQGN